MREAMVIAAGSVRRFGSAGFGAEDTGSVGSLIS
jgi:hypothetical protein